LQRLGYSPYTALPADPALAKLHTAETRNLNNPDVPSPYPAGAQFFFRAVTSVHESAFAFKVAFALCNLGIIALLLVELSRVGQQHWVLAYAWHPMLVTCVYYNSHIDVLGVFFLLLSIAALARQRRALATVALGLAIAIKFLPVVLAPLYWGRVRVRDWLLAAAVVGLLYLPFLNRGPLPTGSLRAFVQRFRFNDPIFALLEHWIRPEVAAGVAIACPLAASLICLPVIYPWYLLWLLPFLRAGSTLILMTWTLSILSVFVVWHLYTPGRPWQVPGWVLTLEFVPVAIAVSMRALHRALE
jgi:alpha-1,6-mannosyltransferase